MQNIVSSDSTYSTRFTDLDANKLRGGYYTSSELATWLCAWAVRTQRDRISRTKLR